MKLLRIKASGLPLFKKGISLSFFAQQRVDESARDSLSPLFPSSRFYLNCANALIGINASGKTSALKVILLAISIANNEPINHCETRDILGDAKEAIIIINFLSNNNELCQLETHISSITKHSTRFYRIIDETLWVKPVSSVTTKSKLTDFTNVTPYSIRTNEEVFLPEDTSIIIAYNKKNSQLIPVESLLSFTNMNVLPISDSIPAEVIQFLDPTVESLSFKLKNQKVSIHLKFRGEKELVLSDSSELNRYLSSGTIKGIVTFTFAIQTLQSGGYLVIDELENHFNKEIASTLIRFFMDNSVNKKGGILIFSTHYPEILDEFDRNDCIFITRNRNGITVDNLADILKRNDLKKSDAYQSGFLDGTIPSYKAYLRLKKNIQSALSKED